MNCGKCAAEIRPQHRFCEECGTPVVSEEEQARKAAEESAERRSEKIVEEYLKKYSLPFTILRYGSVYSERSYKNNYIYNLVKSAVLKGEINHNGDGNELREYIHAADASKLSVDIIESEDFKNLHVILTGNERMKRSDLFDMVKEILNDQVEIKYRNDGYHNHYNFTPYSFEPSVSRKLLANPHIDMGQGLLECVRSVHKNEK